jgi:hypothetical protein
VRDEARPDPRDADELHDALMIAGFLDAMTWSRSALSFRPEAGAGGGHQRGDHSSSSP